MKKAKEVTTPEKIRRAIAKEEWKVQIYIIPITATSGWRVGLGEISGVYPIKRKERIEKVFTCIQAAGISSRLFSESPDPWIEIP